MLLLLFCTAFINTEPFRIICNFLLAFIFNHLLAPPVMLLFAFGGLADHVLLVLGRLLLVIDFIFEPTYLLLELLILFLRHNLGLFELAVSLNSVDLVQADDLSIPSNGQYIFSEVGICIHQVIKSFLRQL